MDPEGRADDETMPGRSFPPAIGARQLRRRTLRDAIGASALVVADAALGEAAIACLAEICSTLGKPLWRAAGEAYAPALRHDASRKADSAGPTADPSGTKAGNLSDLSLRFEGSMAVIEEGNGTARRFDLNTLDAQAPVSGSESAPSTTAPEARSAVLFAVGCLGAAALGLGGSPSVGGACALDLLARRRTGDRHRRDLEVFVSALRLAGPPDPLP